MITNLDETSLAVPEADVLLSVEGIKMENYLEKVSKNMRDVRAGLDPITFDNDGVGYAKIVSAVMFEYAVETVDVYSEALHGDVFSTEELKKRAHAGVKFRIVTESRDVLENQKSALYGLTDLIVSGAVELRFTVASGINHLCIVDKNYVRFELDHDARQALVSFGDETFASDVNRMFEAIWRSALPYSMPNPAA